MKPGERMRLQDDRGDWVPVIVLTAFGEGLGRVLLAVRRLTDGQRLILFRDGDLVEVPG